jgi:uncharacterized coiled-coil protein SlyX
MRKSLCIAVSIGFVLGVAAQPQPQQTVPLDYRQRIANTAPANKADSLAWGVLTVQAEVLTVQGEVGSLRSQASQTFNNHAQLISGLQQGVTSHEQRVKKLEQDVPSTIQHIQAIEAQNLKAQIDEVTKQLNEFRTATCPLLKSSKLKDAEKAQAEKVCQSN